MLGKLIKYDMKALSRVLILAQIPILPLTLLVRFWILPELQKDGIDFVLVTGIAAYILYTAVSVTLTSLYIAVYTYKNLFSDQGYLTLTLPASPMQHLLSKTISGGFWMAVNCLIIMLSLFFIYYAPEVGYFAGTSMGREFAAGFAESMGGLSIRSFTLWCIALEIIGCLSSPLMLLGSVCFGQLFSNHRVLWSVIGYTLLSIISGLFGSGYSFRSVYQRQMAAKGTNAVLNTTPYFTDLMIFAIALSVIAGLLCFILSYWVLKKKVNLH